MQSKNLYFLLLIAHALFGILLYLFSFLGTFVSLAIFIFGVYKIINSKDKNFEALCFAAYVVGVEILLKMTGGSIFNEYGKYSVMIFLFLGIVFRGFSNKSLIYVLFILLFIPGIYFGIQNLNLDSNIRKAIAFNVSGPICLAVASIYCYDKRVSLSNIKNVLIFLGLPIVSILSYLFIHTPSVRDVVTGTQSNFETSGGFGPNQVSTILGLGMFVFFTFTVLYSQQSKRLLIVNAIVTMLMSYRAIVTFSRGGVFAGLACILILLFFLYVYSNSKSKIAIQKVAIALVFLGLGVWSYSSYQTNGLIQNRYENKDARGRVKNDALGGREQIAASEIQMFEDNPLTGVGIGKNKEYREEMTGIVAASHNEITRMLAEQGVFGVVGLLILFIVPMVHYFDNRQHIFLFSFLAFWFLTINHAAMRIAAPAFVYALSLLNVSLTDEKTPVRR